MIITNCSSNKNPVESNSCHNSIDLLSTEQGVSDSNEEVYNEEFENEESKIVTVDVNH